MTPLTTPEVKSNEKSETTKEETSQGTPAVKQDGSGWTPTHG
ncbi:hypothetical protein [Tolypothrix sp. VBCCA 56010]